MIEMQKFDFCREGQRVLYDNLILTLKIFAGDWSFTNSEVYTTANILKKEPYKASLCTCING